jgi:hypothetical protein
MIGRLAGIVINCPAPRALAGFYEALRGAKRVDDSDEWVTLTYRTSLHLPLGAVGGSTSGAVAPDHPRGVRPSRCVGGSVDGQRRPSA